MLKTLQKAVKKALEKSDSVKVMLDEATEDEEKKVLSSKFEKSMEEVKDLQIKLGKAIEEAKLRKSITELDAEATLLLTPVIEEETVLESEEPKKKKKAFGEPIDHEEKDTVEEDTFYEYLAKGLTGMPESKRTILEIKGPDSKWRAGEQRVPHAILRKMFPGLEFGQKALPMLSSDNDASGGRANLLWPEYHPDLLQLPPDVPSLWERCQKKTTVGGTLKYPRLTQTDDNEFGGVVVTRNTEGQEANDTEMDFDLETIQCYQLDAYTTCSKTLLRRSRLALEREIMSKFRGALRYVWDKEIASGSGSGEATGIVNTVNIREENRTAANQVCWEDLVNLIFALKAAHAFGASLIISRTVHKYLMKEKDEDGRPLFNASTGVGMHDRLAGERWFEAYHASDLGSEGDVIFGNLAHYWHVIEEDMVISRSEHAEFKKGLVAYRLEAYSGGELMHPRAFSMLTDVSS